MNNYVDTNTNTNTNKVNNIKKVRMAISNKFKQLLNRAAAPATSDAPQRDQQPSTDASNASRRHRRLSSCHLYLSRTLTRHREAASAAAGQAAAAFDDVQLVHYKRTSDVCDATTSTMYHHQHHQPQQHKRLRRYSAGQTSSSSCSSSCSSSSSEAYATTTTTSTMSAYYNNQEQQHVQTSTPMTSRIVQHGALSARRPSYGHSIHTTMMVPHYPRTTQQQRYNDDECHTYANVNDQSTCDFNNVAQLMEESTQVAVDEPVLVESTFNTSSCSNLSDDLIILQTQPTPQQRPRQRRSLAAATPKPLLSSTRTNDMIGNNKKSSRKSMAPMSNKRRSVQQPRYEPVTESTKLSWCESIDTRAASRLLLEERRKLAMVTQMYFDNQHYAFNN